MLDPRKRLRAEDALKSPVFTWEDTVVLVPPRLGRSGKYGNMEGIRLVDRLDGFTLEDFMGEMLRSAKVRWYGI